MNYLWEMHVKLFRVCWYSIYLTLCRATIDQHKCTCGEVRGLPFNDYWASRDCLNLLENSPNYNWENCVETRKEYSYFKPNAKNVTKVCYTSTIITFYCTENCHAQCPWLKWTITLLNPSKVRQKLMYKFTIFL